MNPHSLDFKSPLSPLSPRATPKRRILGEITNKPNSPLIERLKSPEHMSPLKSPMVQIKTSMSQIISPMSQIISPMSQTISPMSQRKSPMSQVNSPLKRSPMSIASPLMNSPLTSLPLLNSPLTSLPLLNSPLTSQNSPIVTRSINRMKGLKRSSKITKIFEERTKFKENKENEILGNEFLKFDLGEEARDSFGERFNQERGNWTSAKLDFTDSIPSKSSKYPERENQFSFSESHFSQSESHFSQSESHFSQSESHFSQSEPQFSHSESFGLTESQNFVTVSESEKYSTLVPESQEIDDLESLQDLEAEFESESFEHCTKYEIISTDSPNVISNGRATSRKVISRNFEFGAPLADNEQSTSFNRPATRMLTFDEDNFEFTSPAMKRNVVKKSLKFNETPTKNPLRHERSDSSIGSMSLSPSSSKLRLFPSDSTTSMESGFISELDEPFLEIEDSNSPKIANFSDLLSGRIKENIITDRNFMKRPTLARSLSFQPENRARTFRETCEEKRKREEDPSSSSKRRRSNEARRPPLQRAFSENHATDIQSALARSCESSDLIGDYSGPHSLPLTPGDHSDLKSISCDTLAALLRGRYADTVPRYQVIDCRYPYEYSGGHITSAVNLHSPDQLQAFLESHATTTPQRTVLVFHCEYSIERGPKLSRMLRACDRARHADSYPALCFPELYLLRGGYRAFHAAHAALCSGVEGGGYTAMNDPTHRHLLRRHRSKDSHRLLLYRSVAVEVNMSSSRRSPNILQNKESPPASASAQSAPPALELLVTGTQIPRRTERAKSLPGSNRQSNSTRSKASEPRRSEPKRSEQRSEPQSSSRGTSLEDDLFSLDLSQVSDFEDQWKTGIRPKFAALATSTPKPTLTPKTSQSTPKTGQSTPKTGQSVTKSSQNTPKTGENAPNGIQNASKFNQNPGQRSRSASLQSHMQKKMDLSSRRSQQSMDLSSKRQPLTNLSIESSSKRQQSMDLSSKNIDQSMDLSSRSKLSMESSTLQFMDLSSNSHQLKDLAPNNQISMDLSTQRSQQSMELTSIDQQSADLSSLSQQLMDLSSRSQQYVKSQESTLSCSSTTYNTSASPYRHGACESICDQNHSWTDYSRSHDQSTTPHKLQCDTECECEKSATGLLLTADEACQLSACARALGSLLTAARARGGGELQKGGRSTLTLDLGETTAVPAKDRASTTASSQTDISLPNTRNAPRVLHRILRQLSRAGSEGGDGKGGGDGKSVGEDERSSKTDMIEAETHGSVKADGSNGKSDGSNGKADGSNEKEDKSDAMQRPEIEFSRTEVP